MMKHILILLFIIIPAGIHAQIDQITSFDAYKNYNYIFSNTILLSSTIINYQENFQYFDGFGRSLQTVDYKASPTLKDIIQPVEYDISGRDSIRYLPYTASASGAYRSDWKTKQSTFFTGIFGSTDGTKAYSKTLFESSPLSRMIKQGAPGSAWQPDMTTNSRVPNEHVASFQFATNSASTAYYWTITGTYSTTSTATFTRNAYLANMLYKTVVTDENGKATTEYKDKQGKVVLKTDALGGKTYYVYDDFELLRCVIPPLCTLATLSSFTTNNAQFQELCYYYDYDSRHRMIKKKLPGTVGYFTMTYDGLDRLIATKDPKGTTITTTYDDFSRPIQSYNSTTSQWLTKTHYDSYIKNGISYKAILPYANVYSYDTITYKGKPTVAIIRVLNPLTGMKDSLRSVTYYDKYGRVIQTVSENHRGTIERVSYKYKYKNSDLVLQTKFQHGITGSTASQTVLETNNFDHAGRLIAVRHKINTQTEVTLDSMVYNEAGQMTTKKIGKTSAATFLQENSYTYNIRGWLTYINNPDVVNNGKLFNLKLEYVYYGNSNNITYMTWNNVDGINKKYYFSYDNLNRITGATYYETNANNKYNESYTYDANGNIITAKRYGLLQDGSGHQGMIDDLNYVFYNSNFSNRLYAVGDNTLDVEGRGDFLETTAANGSSLQEYYYDNNGNLTSDANKMVSITYNCLNLPQSTAQYSNLYSNYSYMVTGQKIASKCYDGSTTTKMEYIGPFVYKNGNLDHIATSEGRALFTGTSSSTFSCYEYHIKDHLGNVRAAYIPYMTTSYQVVQKNDYYPFGLLMADRTDNGINKNKYLYNGKEYLKDARLQMYDYGARMYDPQLGRWNRKDPLMEWHFNYSPYAYCYNNPLSYVDPFGLDTVPVNSDKPIKKDDVVVMDDGTTVTSSTDAVYCYGPKPEKKGFWGFVIFVGGDSDGSESLARKVSWDRVLGFINISFLQDMFDAFWRGKELHKKIKDTDQKMAGKGIKRALQTPDKDINPNNKTNADGEEIDNQGQPTNRVEHGYTQDFKHETILENRGDSIILKVVNYPGDTSVHKSFYPKNK